MSVDRNDRCRCGRGSLYRDCCEARDQEFDNIITTGQLKTILGTKVWSPSLDTHIDLRKELEEHIRGLWPPGEYRDAAVISQILRALFAKCDEIIVRELHPVACWGTLDFVLKQLDQWTKVFWTWRYGPDVPTSTYQKLVEKTTSTRRALMHLSESLAALNPSATPWRTGTIRHLERALVAAEDSFMFAQLSDQTYRLFPTDTVLEIHPPGEQLYLTVQLDDEAQRRREGYLRRQKRWEELSGSAYAGVVTDGDATNDLERIIALMDPSFRGELGFGSDELVHVVKLLRDCTAQSPNYLSPVATENSAITEIAKSTGLLEDHVRFILGMFTLDSRTLQTEPPEIRRIKRLNRLNRRPFIRLNHPTGPALMWSDAAVTEALGMFWFDLAKRKVQPELADVSPIHGAIQELHDSQNARLEQVTLRELNKRGFVGRNGVESGSLRNPNGKKILVPAGVGEIDILCIHPLARILLIAECKNPTFAPEPAPMYEDLQDFVLGNGRKPSYRDKYLKKVRWAIEHKDELVSSLALENQLKVDGTWTVVTLMVTAFPSIVSEFVDDIPCEPLVNFLDDYDRANSWPYELHA